MTVADAIALITALVGGGFLGKMLERLLDAWRERRTMQVSPQTEQEALRLSRAMWQEETAKARYRLASAGIALDPLPVDPYPPNRWQQPPYYQPTPTSIIEPPQRPNA